MNKRILVVEDHGPTSDFLRATLEIEGYEVQVIGNGISALAQVKANPPDLILLDVVLPGIDGFEVCRFVRQREGYIPIIMLTGQREEDDKITGLELGADDYVTKPFGARELLARVQAVFRLAQQSGGQASSGRIEFDQIVIDCDQRAVIVDGLEVELTRKEFDLLVLLAQAPGRVFDRDELFKQVWGYDYVGKSRTLDVHVQQLRSKIEADPSDPRYLVTVRGVGYKFERQNK
ncbi:MAG: response regulator transcription factor [Anaerolineae bacterium]|nr:response regulator transcription factor [Anaerolineae bacterium]